MYVRDQLVQKYGEDMVDSGGLKVITTLDYDMQQKAEDVITKFAPSLETNFNASNTAMVAIDPTNGDILTMVGSENYFDLANDGNFNVTLAKRQPGSTFKPFIYVTDFEKGYTSRRPRSGISPWNSRRSAILTALPRIRHRTRRKSAILPENTTIRTKARYRSVTRWPNLGTCRLSRLCISPASRAPSTPLMIYGRERSRRS